MFTQPGTQTLKREDQRRDEASPSRWLSGCSFEYPQPCTSLEEPCTERAGELRKTDPYRFDMQRANCDVTSFAYRTLRPLIGRCDLSRKDTNVRHAAHQASSKVPFPCV